MASVTELKLRGLSLSASDLRDLTGWSEVLIKDYLDKEENFKIIANEVDEKESAVTGTTLVSSTPYQITADDSVIFVDTSSAPIVLNLPEGIDGTRYKIVNAKTSGNNVTLNAYSGEFIFAAENTVEIYDLEVFDLTFEDGLGWY